MQHIAQGRHCKQAGVKDSLSDLPRCLSRGSNWCWELPTALAGCLQGKRQPRRILLFPCSTLSGRDSTEPESRRRTGSNARTGSSGWGGMHLLQVITHVSRLCLLQSSRFAPLPRNAAVLLGTM